jgi:hypothetical protein
VRGEANNITVNFGKSKPNKANKLITSTARRMNFIIFLNMDGVLWVTL